MTRSTALSLAFVVVAAAAIILSLSIAVPIKECSSGWGHQELLEPGQTPTPTPVGLDENGCVTRNMLDGLLDDEP